LNAPQALWGTEDKTPNESVALMMISKLTLAAALAVGVSLVTLTPGVAQARGGGGRSASGHSGHGVFGAGRYGAHPSYSNYGYRTPFGRNYHSCAYVTPWGQCAAFINGYRR